MQTALGDILHVISQALLIPDMVLLIGLIAYALFSIGSILIEWMTERRRFKVKMPQFLDAMISSSMALIPTVIAESGLLRRQREALMIVYDYRNLPGDALIALVRREMTEEEARYDRVTDRNGMAARVAPMLGLVGTLVPLGPGIQALGKADTELLSTSLLVAFDTTVAGLVAASVCMVIAKIRGAWYNNYLSALDSGMATLVQKIEDARGPIRTTASEVTSAGMPITPAQAQAQAYEAAAANAAVAAANEAAAQEAAKRALQEAAEQEAAQQEAIREAAREAARAAAEEVRASTPSADFGAMAGYPFAAPAPMASGIPVATPMPDIYSMAMGTPMAGYPVAAAMPYGNPTAMGGYGDPFAVPSVNPMMGAQGSVFGLGAGTYPGMGTPGSVGGTAGAPYAEYIHDSSTQPSNSGQMDYNPYGSF